MRGMTHAVSKRQLTNSIQLQFRKPFDSAYGPRIFAACHASRRVGGPSKVVKDREAFAAAVLRRLWLRRHHAGNGECG